MRKIFIDSNSLICRFAFATDFSPDGFGVGGVVGFGKFLLSLILESPTSIVCLFDKCSNNFRKKLDANYKKNRAYFPNIGYQVNLALELCKQSEIPVDYHEENEADDLIASYAHTHEDCLIISNDKDLLQLVSHKTLVYNPFSKIIFTEEEVIKKFNIPPNQLKYFLALCGDQADNIKGINKIGPKTAVKILHTLSDKNLPICAVSKIFPQFDFTDFDLMLQLVSLNKNVEQKHKELKLTDPFLLDVNLKIISGKL